MIRTVALACTLLLATVMAPAAQAAAAVAPREGWVVIDTDHSFAELVERTRSAVTDAKMGLVTQASASDGAKGQGIRFYLTENADGTATLSYKSPSFVFAPYADEGGADLAALAAELDAVFAGIAEAATGAHIPR